MTQEAVSDWRAEASEDDKESRETLATKSSLDRSITALLADSKPRSEFGIFRREKKICIV
jgi:hypothetical protein